MQTKKKKIVGNEARGELWNIFFSYVLNTA